MTKAEGYAQALFSLTAAQPGRAAQYLKQLRGVLAARHEQALLPAIFRHYETILTTAERLTRYRARTPQDERTRVLVELYHRLIERT